MRLEDGTILYKAAPFHHLRENGSVVLVDPVAPNWLATDGRGEAILERFDGQRSFGNVVKEYAGESDIEWAKARQHVETIARDALRQGLLKTEMPETRPYEGRESYLEGGDLKEIWIHTNNTCNLTCSHCLVSSGPDGIQGLDTKDILDIIEQARGLGTKRFYFTGGEPLLRKDMLELAEAALADPEAKLVILTNGTMLRGRRLEELRALDQERFRLQVSLDGPTAEVNDLIRGRGSFGRICGGISNAVEAGFSLTVTTVITESNADDVPRVTRLLAEMGVKNHHLLWLHKRGRAAGVGVDRTPPVARVIDVVLKAQDVGKAVGVIIDNAESLKIRLNAPAGTKRDLSNACVESLCVYSDGKVYPSAATANVPELVCGDIRSESLESIFRESEVSRRFRAATVEQKEICRGCEFKFLCGGGDIEHSYFYGGSLESHDPYCDLHKTMISEALLTRAEERAGELENRRSGFDAPVAVTGMGEGSVHCAAGEEVPEVVTSHSECVLSFELDAPRALVREFYGAAAEEPQQELCCPVQPDAADISHIPMETLERFYGCGSPVNLANIQPGETTLDLGSGAGIDVFIAAKLVGEKGKAIGVDMTDEMLRVAHESQETVAGNLGYDAVEFRRGFLEEIPAADAEVDLITSNCVINLSPDKKRVFSEMWRVLKDHGRAVVSDIISEEEVPPHQRRDPRLWGECISGALTEEEFLAYLERAGFYGVQVVQKSFWKEVEGYRFYSICVRGYKFEKKDGCKYIGQVATYQGPFKGVSDEEGHYFPRGAPVEVCTDTAAKLSQTPYAGMFVVASANGANNDGQKDYVCCTTEESSDGQGAKCC